MCRTSCSRGAAYGRKQNMIIVVLALWHHRRPSHPVCYLHHKATAHAPTSSYERATGAALDICLCTCSLSFSWTHISQALPAHKAASATRLSTRRPWSSCELPQTQRAYAMEASSHRLWRCSSPFSDTQAQTVGPTDEHSRNCASSPNRLRYTAEESM